MPMGIHEDLYIGVEPKIRFFHPKSSTFNRVFHYLFQPSIFGWKHPNIFITFHDSVVVVGSTHRALCRLSSWTMLAGWSLVACGL